MQQHREQAKKSFNDHMSILHVDLRTQQSQYTRIHPQPQASIGMNFAILSSSASYYAGLTARRGNATTIVIAQLDIAISTMPLTIIVQSKF